MEDACLLGRLRSHPLFFMPPRYFECKSKHGLFAPAHKVSRSPRNRMQRQPSNLATPLKLCRQKSDLSDVSMTSVASTATAGGSRIPPRKKVSIPSVTAPERLRTSLKEKEAKIEQLLKEREMERQQVS